MSHNTTPSLIKPRLTWRRLRECDGGGGEEEGEEGRRRRSREGGKRAKGGAVHKLSPINTLYISTVCVKAV